MNGVHALRCGFALAAFAAAVPAIACTTIVAGRNATSTGYVMLGHNEDDRGDFQVLHAFVPPRSFATGTTLPAEKDHAAVPQVPKTLGFYWSEVWNAKWRPSFADAFLNEKGVAIVSNNARGKPQKDPALLQDGGMAWTLRFVVAERATSARHAVDVITNLVSAWGYAAPGRIYTVADRDEAWIVELVYGRRHFVARRVADDEVAMIPNSYTIRAIEPGDVIAPDLAQKGKGFDFAREFQREDAWKDGHSQDRTRNMVRLLTGRDWKNDDYPFSVKPVRKVDVAMMRKVLSAHYEGTPDEIPAGADGLRHDESRITPICRRSTVESSVYEFAATPFDTCLTVAVGSPCSTPWRTFHPLQRLPPDLDRSSDALERLAAHPLPTPRKARR